MSGGERDQPDQGRGRPRRRAGRLAGARGLRRHPAVRRPHQPGRRLADDGERLGARRHRSERRRQDLAVQLPHRRLPPAARARSSSTAPSWRRRLDPRPQAAQDRPARHRPHLPEHPAVPGADGAGERPGRGRDAAAFRPDQPHARAARTAAATTGRAPPRRIALLDRVGLRGARNDLGRRRCPTASSAGWRSPARSAPGPSCCCWTSRPPAPTRPRSASSRR